MIRFFHTFVNYQLDDWLEILTMVKILANNNIFASTKLFSILATKGSYFHKSFDIIDYANINTYERIFK